MTTTDELFIPRQRVSNDPGDIIARGSVTTIRRDPATGYDIVRAGTGAGVVIVPRKVIRGIAWYGVVEQYRHALHQVTVEFPRGGMDPDESPVHAAIRETVEETGIVLDESNLHSLGVLHPDTGLLDTTVHVYMASVTSIADAPHEDGIELEWLQLGNLMGMARNGRITCGMTLASLFMLEATGLRDNIA